MWLHICPSSPVSERLTSDSALPNHGYELWVTSSGTPLQRPSSWRGWKTRPWIRLLSGTTLPRSQAVSTAERWISSLPASRVSRSAQQASGEVRPMTGGSGPSLPTQSKPPSPGVSSLRTSPVSSDTGLPISSETLPKAGTMRSGVCSERTPTPVPPTDGSGSSSWPTPTASSYGTNQGGGAGRTGKVRPSLNTLAAQWPTPTATATDSKASGAAAYSNGRNVTLTDATVRGYSRQAQMTPMPGKGTRVLNPQFVETLMGLPIGWTDFEPLATQPYRSVLPPPTRSSPGHE